MWVEEVGLQRQRNEADGVEAPCTPHYLQWTATPTPQTRGLVRIDARGTWLGG